MSARLHLKLEKSLDNDAVENAVVANVYASPSAHEPTISGRDRRDLVIPSGSLPPKIVDVDPGHYVVEALLPSGEILTSEVTLGEGEDAAVTLQAQDSPHEWLSWPHLMGNVTDPPTAGAHAPVQRTNPVVHWIDNPVAELGGVPGKQSAWSSLSTLIEAHGPAAYRLSPTPVPVPAFTDDGQYQLYQFCAAGPANYPNPQLPQWTNPGPPRRYLLVETEHGSELVSMPVPWLDVNRYQEVVVQAVVRRQVGPDDPITTVTIRDGSVGSALGYMTLGALPTAELLFDQAREMLFMKMSNPLAAAAGGYVLLATEQGSEPKEWHQWVENLCNRFEWMPDGAILRGSLKLRHQQSDADVEEARSTLKTAYRRGLPFYSVGLQWLLDGLTVCGQDDPEGAAMAKDVQRVSWRCNMQEPFTVVRLRR